MSAEKVDLEQGTVNSHDHAHPNGANGYDNTTTGAPLDRSVTAGTNMMPAWGGAFQPGPYKPSFRKFGNPAPLGLCAFALTTFVLSLTNANTRHVSTPNIVVGLAYAYGGIIQLLAGMWEMAVGNTFGATALSSYGGFWISYGIIQTGGFGIVAAYEDPTNDPNGHQLHAALGFYLIAWFIFTFMMCLCTMRSTLAFFSLFFFLDITFMLLAIGNFMMSDATIRAAGVFGLITAFIAWWNALAGLLDSTNSFFTVPVLHFPWSEKVRKDRAAHQD